MRPFRLYVLLALLLSGRASAQSFHFGLKAGVPVTEYWEIGPGRAAGNYSAATRRYTVGASAEWRFHTSVGLELDVLYKRMGYVGIVSALQLSSPILTTSSFDVKGNSWDFPLLAKYRFHRARGLYAAGGGVMRYIGPVRARGEAIVNNPILGTIVRSPIDTTEPSDLRKRLYPGLTATCGLELGRGRLHLLPEFRYTRWTANIAGPGGLLRFAPNQAEVLVGLLF